MKTIMSLIVAAVLVSASSSEKNPSAQDLKTTCQVLSILSDNAIDKNRKDLLTVYYNAYQAIRSENKFTDNCDTYFAQIKSNYGTTTGDWSIRMDFPPKKYTNPLGGGFTHHEIELMDKLKTFELSNEDLDQLLFIKQLQDDNIDVELMKKFDPKELNKIQQNLNKLDLKNVKPEKLNNIKGGVYEIEELKQKLD